MSAQISVRLSALGINLMPSGGDFESCLNSFEIRLMICGDRFSYDD
jgi:hypothetical protein